MRTTLLRMTGLRAPGVCALTLGICTALGCAPAPDTDDVASAPVTTSAATGSGDSAGRVPVELPDLSEMNEAVQAQIRQRHSSLVSEAGDSTASPATLAEAHGALGMILMAADLREPAIVSFVNAQTLAPTDLRWPYYLGHLYRREGDLAQSLESFTRARELQPDYLATLSHLGDIYLEQGAPDLAEPLFAEVLAQSPESEAAKFGLGRVALMRDEFEVAVTYLEEVLEQNPDAAAVHYSLGLAYRGLGDVEQAEAHLLLRVNEQINLGDSLMATVDALLESPQAFERRGIEALGRGDWAGAETLFNEGLELDPGNPALRHRMGTALYLEGDPLGALTIFEDVVQSSPEYPPAQFSLGVLYQEMGRHREAVDRFATALEYRPTYIEARLMLATSLRRSGDPAAALPHYEQLLSTNPDVAEARFGRAMAYVQLHRYQEARDHLSREMELYPDDPSFPHALARLLAAAPDDRVRNGERALELMQPLIQGQRTFDLGETMAMILAELGRFDEAISIQESLIGVAQNPDLAPLLGTLRSNMALYEQGQPARIPWPPNAIP